MLLSDAEMLIEILSGNLVITPLISAEQQLGACSIDVRLGTEFRLMRTVKQERFDLSLPTHEFRRQVRHYTELVHVPPLTPFILHPNEFALASTLEYLRIPDYLAGQIDGRSSWGRVGLQIHSTAGLVDPGFEGTLTFELHNMGKLPLPLYPGARVAQMSFYRCASVVQPYSGKAGAKYAKAPDAKESVFYEDYEYQLIMKRQEQTSGVGEKRTSPAKPAGET